VAGLVCPIGAQGSADKRPEVIAAFVAAEIMARLTQPDAQTRTPVAPDRASPENAFGPNDPPRKD
jgi:xanthine dehydrogenase accessory factor